MLEAKKTSYFQTRRETKSSVNLLYQELSFGQTVFLTNFLLVDITLLHMEVEFEKRNYSLVSNYLPV
jgi:hypothetical protein